MDLREIQETPIWRLFQKGQDYHRRMNVYTDTDRNYRMYNGDQWAGAKLGDVEPVQKNFIKPIVKYKVAVLHDNLYAVNFSSENFDNPAFRKEAERYCEMLNRYERRVWERDKLDFKLRRFSKDAAINGEGIIYVDFNKETMTPINEIVKKNDIHYGNENDDDIQNQPYILLSKRMPVTNAMLFAEANGVSGEKLEYIIADNDTFEQSGEDAKQEVDDMVTIVYKLYKQDGTVHFSAATKWLTIIEDYDMGLSMYPITHFNWEEKEGSARGEGEVRYLIPNQIEVNRTEMRRVLTVKNQAYPKTVADVTKIANPGALDAVGGVIHTNGQPVDDIHKIVGTLPPAQMSPDVVKLQEDLINVTRDLAGAGDSATGQIDPEQASGRAILAVQQANKSPLTEQKENFKNSVEDLARIHLDYLIVHSADGVNLEEEVTDPTTGKKVVVVVKVPQVTLQELKATVNIDITPKSPYDRFAQEQTIENLLTSGFFTAQRVTELEVYANLLDDDAVAPKVKILEAIDRIKEEQRKIAMINAQAQAMQQRANMFINEGPEAQMEHIRQAEAMLQGQQMPLEAEVEEQEAKLDNNPDDN